MFAVDARGYLHLGLMCGLSVGDQFCVEMINDDFFHVIEEAARPKGFVR